MQTSVQLITPGLAAKHLEKLNERIAAGEFRQRGHNEATSDQYARDMKRGYWLLNHQGIAFDSDGNLIDGQHRLHAVVKSGVSVKMLVTTGMTCSVTTGIEIKTMDTIDGGRTRTVGNKLQIDGFENSNRMAAIAKAIACMATGETTKVTVSQTKFILKTFEASIGVAVACLSKPNQRAQISAPLALYAEIEPSKAELFGCNLSRLENLAYSNPVMALNRWLMHHAGGWNNRGHCTRVVCSAISAHHEGRTLSKIYANEEAFQWLLAVNKKKIRQVADATGKV